MRPTHTSFDDLEERPSNHESITMPSADGNTTGIRHTKSQREI
jgi:hypothetical protein